PARHRLRLQARRAGHPAVPSLHYCLLLPATCQLGITTPCPMPSIQLTTTTDHGHLGQVAVDKQLSL
ncbi:MAG: hypothetical protein WBH05_13120, partial [Syntrophobacteria bacterium]